MRAPALALCLALLAPVLQGQEKERRLGLRPGTWHAFVEAEDGTRVPFVLELQASMVTTIFWIRNGAERIRVPEVDWQGNDLILRLPHHDAELKAKIVEEPDGLRGHWRRRRADGDSVLPFEAHFVQQEPVARDGSAVQAIVQPFARKPAGEAAVPPITGRWQVQLSRDPQPAVGIFEEHDDGIVTGTFLTTLGDYRYLAGRRDGRTLRLATFDGAHAFRFEAELQDDGRLVGTFASLPTWRETWVAHRDDDASLPDAWTLTSTDGEIDTAARFEDLDGELRRLDDPAFAGRARLLVVFGTWCPNCKDATNLLTELHAAYADAGLRVLGLAFEHERPAEATRAVVRRYAQLAGIEYPILLAGLSDKEAASRALPWLDRVRAYPTFVFTDERGRIAGIYTGFSGPATGEAHEALKRAFRARIEQLLDRGGPR